MKKNSFVKQASFLMIAGLIVRFIGLIYRPLMKANIGELGYAYYGYAYNVYFILLLVSGYSIPVAVSKLMSERLAKKQYRNAIQIFKGSLFYIIITAGIAAIVAYVFPEYLLPKGGEGASLALQILAPTILLSGILGVFRGYFQAYGNMMPTATSQVLESIFNALFAIIMGNVFIKSFAKNKAQKAVYGAAGATVGPGAGILIGIIFMIFVFNYNKKFILRKLKKDTKSTVISYSEVMKIILSMLTPVILSTFAYNVIGYLDQTLFAPLIMAKDGCSGEKAALLFNQYNGMYGVLIRIPMAFADASSTALIPVITASFALKKFNIVEEHIAKAIKMTMVISIPSVVGLSILAYPAMELLFGEGNEIASKMLMYGSGVVILGSLSTISTGILQGIGKQSIPLRNALISVACHVVLLIIVVRFTPARAYGLIITYYIYMISMCTLNIYSIKKYVNFKIDFKGAFKAPFVSSIIMGIVIYVFYFGFNKIASHPSVLLIFTILLGMFIYLVAIVKVSKVTEEEICEYPKGYKVVKLLKKINVL